MKKLISIVMICVMTALTALPCGIFTANAETLPAAVDLSTTIHLPKIGNQGAVGCCVSMAATYMQLTNAYSRYLHELDPNITWDPSSGSAKYCFAPRFTYNLGGAATAEVYRILEEQGAPTQTWAQFSGGVTGYASNDKLAKDWATIDGSWDEAQRFRISTFDQVWAIKDDMFYNGTQSGEGAALINRIKEALNAGNVVVTGGYPDRWVTDLVTISAKGTYGKSGDKAIPYSTNVSSGGHQVSIVGYDDNITCVKNGVTLKGAFKIANSWGSWQNSGFIWMMYDALNGNGQSQYGALNVANRIWTMDQFIFLDYRTDLNYGTPELMAKVTINTADRDNFSVTLRRTDVSTGVTDTYLPVMFKDRSRADYNEGYGFYGDKNGPARDGILTFNYDKLTKDLPAGKTLDDYIWGVEVTYFNSDSGKTPTVKKVQLLKNGSVVCTRSGLNASVTKDQSRVIDLDGRRAVSFDLAPGVTVVPQNGTAFIGNAGDSVSFTVSVKSGYKADKILNVYHNGVKIYPLDGVYTVKLADGEPLGANVVKVDGVRSTSVKSIDISNYGDGFENPYGTYWLVFTVSNSAVDADVVDLAAIDARTYKYTIRITVDGVSYDFLPDSYYDFGTSTLFRVNVADQGWFPVTGKNYVMRIEFCKNGVPLYRDTDFRTPCKVTPTSSDMPTHTHVFDGEALPYITSSCIANGTGYVRCSVKGCKAMQSAEMPLDSTAHTFSGELTVTKNASAHEPGELSFVCRDCGAKVFARTFTAGKCDVNGDNRVTVEDVTTVLDRLSNTITDDDLASSCDFNEDGVISIKDVTYLLLVESGLIIL